MIRFRIDKCWVQTMRRGKKSKCEGITIGNREVIDETESDGHKYVDNMERSDVFQEQMKRSVKAEYFKRVRSAHKINVENVFQATNIWAAPTVRYVPVIVKWTKEELQQMDRKSSKLINVYGELHPRSCADRLYILRSDGGRGLVDVEVCAEKEKCSLEKYATQSKEALLKTEPSELSLIKYIVNVSKKKKKAVEKSGRKRNYMDNLLGKQNATMKGELKRESEILIFAAQEQAI